MSEPKETKTVEAPIDLAQLSGAQIAAIQKQLSQRNKEASANRGERNEVIETMLAKKDKDGGFVNTTRAIAKELASKGLSAILTVDNFDSEDMVKEVEKEVRKVQAKKQQLSKATDEKGQLVHPEGTYGYKTSGKGAQGLSGKAVKASTVVAFFTAGRASELTTEQLASIVKAIG